MCFLIDGGCVIVDGGLGWDAHGFGAVWIGGWGSQQEETDSGCSRVWGHVDWWMGFLVVGLEETDSGCSRVWGYVDWWVGFLVVSLEETDSSCILPLDSAASFAGWDSGSA